MSTDTPIISGPVLFGVDVHSIQRYLFATSKLREVVGGSQLVSDFTSTWVIDELKALGLSDEGSTEDGPSPQGYLPVRIGGGSVRLVLPTAAAAADLALRLNCRSIERAPGLSHDIAWVAFDPAGDSLADRNGELIRLLNDRRGKPRGGGGFAGFPFTAPCLLTQNPAVGYGEGGNERLCEASLAKRLAQRDGRGDLLEKVRDHALVRACGDPDTPFEFELSGIADDGNENAYIAVVCVDLNDLGQRGRSAVGNANGRTAARLFHAFTEHVKVATTKAFTHALASLPADAAAAAPLAEARRPGRRLPLRPLVIGGDDLVFVMHAACGIPFAVNMLDSFGDSGFVGGAGITFVKAKSPFSRAVALAEQLVGSAKAGGRDESRLDFLVCTGEIPADLGDVRRGLTTRGCRLFAGPWTIDQFRVLVNRAKLIADLPRSHVRGAVDCCHEGIAEGERAFEDLRENLVRRLGGRPGRRLASAEDLEKLYPHGFFTPPVNGVRTTDLLDCVNLFRFICPAGSRPVAGVFS